MGLGGTFLAIGVILLMVKLLMFLAWTAWAGIAGAGLIMLIIGWLLGGK